MSCNFSKVSADNKGLHLCFMTWNFKICCSPLCLTCKSHSPTGFKVVTPKSFSLTEELFMGGSPNCVIAERSSKPITLHVAPVSNWHAKVVVKSSLADLKKLISESHSFALVWTRDTLSTCKQLSSGLSSSSCSNCWTFFDDRRKMALFWHLLHVFLNAGHPVLLSRRCLRAQYLKVG